MFARTRVGVLYDSGEMREKAESFAWGTLTTCIVKANFAIKPISECLLIKKATPDVV